jgi:hypothetical protein
MIIGFVMSTHLPEKPRAKAISADNPDTGSVKFKPQVNQAAAKIDWLALWALSIAVSAIFIAALVYFGENDTTGAVAVLAGAAGVTALALFFSEAPNQNN